MRYRSIYLIAGWLIIAPVASAQSSLTVHEWGTITTRHARDGTPQGRLNKIEPTEVLPDFVHHFEPSQADSRPSAQFSKGTRTPGNPDVTMRLETPVIYFYPVDRSTTSARFDVTVEMRGGILNEFYPAAEASIAQDSARIAQKLDAGVIGSKERIVLDNYLVSKLEWRGIALETGTRLPQTDSPIWNAPRDVTASSVTTDSHESERFLFYRGVAHLDALLRTNRSRGRVKLSAPEHLHWLKTPSMTLPSVWLVDVHNDGTAAFTMRRGLTIAKEGPVAPLMELQLFSPDRYGHEQTAALRDTMKTALIEAGLYDKEARAMLATWDASYFKTPGLRLFYLVPREWLDYFLPLSISVPHSLTRVLIGRIDLLPQ